MSITTSWPRKFIKSRRSWRRRGAHDSRNNLAWWARLGLSNLEWQRPTPWTQDRASALPVSSQTLYTLYISYWWQLITEKNFSCLLSDGPVPMPNMPNQIMSRMQVPQGWCFVFAFLAVVCREKQSVCPSLAYLPNSSVCKCIDVKMLSKCLVSISTPDYLTS